MWRLVRVFALATEGHLADAREEAEHLPQRGAPELAHHHALHGNGPRSPGPASQPAYDTPVHAALTQDLGFIVRDLLDGAPGGR